MAEAAVVDKNVVVDDKGSGAGATGDEGKVVDKGAADQGKNVVDQAAKDAAAADAAKAAAAAAQKAAWPEDWRTLMDTEGKHAKVLERYASPKAIADALIAAQNKIRSGELKENVPFPDKGSAEEQAAWRKNNGIPEAPEKYDLGQIKVDEDFKPLVDDFLKTAHTKNIPPSAAAASLEFYFEQVQKREEERAQLDIDYKEETENELRTEWGGEYKVNVNMVKTLIETAPEDVRDDIFQARLPNGRPLLSTPQALRWLVGLSRTINPAATIMGGEKGDAAGLEKEIEAIEKTMGTMAYRKDEKVQARYRDLIRARDALAEHQKKK